MVLLILFIVACSKQEKPEGPFTIPENAVTTDSGLKYVTLEEGSGEVAAPGKTVTVHYTGWLMDGKKFESSVDKNRPFEFVLGTGAVIAGWDEGVSGMKVNEKRRLFIPPQLGYGSEGVVHPQTREVVIPGGATLVFDVELLEVK